MAQELGEAYCQLDKLSLDFASLLRLFAGYGIVDFTKTGAEDSLVLSAT